MDDEIAASGQQRTRGEHHAIHFAQGGCRHDDLVAMVAHREDLLKRAERHFRDAAVQLGNAAVEDAPDDDDPGREGTVPAAPQQRQFIADVDLQVARQNRADDDFPGCRAGQVVAALDQPGDTGNPRLEFRLHTVDQYPVAALFAGHEGETGRARCDGIEPEFVAEVNRQRRGSGYALAHLAVILVARRLHLQVTGEGLQGIFDHHPVHAQLQRDHEDEQDIRENHRSGRQPRPAWLAPEISPGEPQGDVHR